MGGVIAGLMLWAWALGRWQGGFAAVHAGAPGVDSVLREPNVPDVAAPDAVRQGQHGARTDHRVPPEADAWIGQIHADVSAYRRTVQVLAHLEAEEMALGWSTVGGERALSCYLRNSGKPTFPATSPGNAPCACSACATETTPLAIRLNQPSAEAPAFARV